MDWKITWLCIFGVLFSDALSKEQCSEDIPLGMGTGEVRIPDASITSSTHEEGSEAYKGRIDPNIKHGAWCPEVPVDMNTYQWIQVDFGEMVTIAHVIIAGEFNDGEGTRFTQKFRVEYQRTEQGPWESYESHSGEDIFNGNMNTRSQHFLTTNHTLLAARVRIVPLSEVRESVCLRLEFWGCFRHGIAEYSSPVGDTRGDTYTFTDKLYDGDLSNGRLTGGLGLLTNGTEGSDSYRASPDDWLGWRDDSQSEVMLLFELDHIRNISQMTIHSNNQFSNGVKVFKQARFYTSIGGAQYTPQPVKIYSHTADTTIESSRDVIIPLHHQVAKFVKVVLEFDAKWIMISEVRFESRLMIGPLPPSEVTTIDVVQPTSSTAQPIIDPEVTRSTTTVRGGAKTTQPDGGSGQVTDRIIPADDTTTPSGYVAGNAGSEINSTLIGIIVGSCMGVILIVVFVIIICCVYQRKTKPSTPTRHHFSVADESSISLPHHTQKNHTAPPGGEPSDVYDLPWSRPLPHPPQPGATLQSSGYMSDTSGAQYACIPVTDQYNNTSMFSTVRGHPQVTNRGPPQSHSLCTSGSCLHHYMTAGGGLLTLPGVNHDRHLCSRQAHTLPIDPHNDLLIPLNCNGKPQNGVIDPHSYDLVQPDACGSPYDSSNYQRSPAASLPNIQGSTGNSVYGAHLTPPTKQIEEELNIIPATHIRCIEKLGAGQYGEVNLCEMTIPQQTGGGNSTTLVAVKKLQSAADEATKKDFIREIRIMSKLRHDNIVQVLGIVSGDTAADSPSVVTEYMTRGDLHQFLQKHVPEGTSLLNKQTLSQNTLLHICSQIAEGMSYLEQLNVTHRDLAARNVLVEDGHRVKITDFGMSRSLYSQQYYKVEGRVVLPIRWMSWESVLLGRFTTRSDVWSYGVTLWEIYSFAREQPYSHMLDDDVIRNCMNYYSGNISEILTLSQPHQCNKEMYDLMRACWNLADYNRPTFKDISLYLQRKTPTNFELNQDRKQSLTRLTTC